MDSDFMLEDLMSQLGEFGSYQLRQHLLHLTAALLAGVHMYSLTTVAPTPEHRCLIPEIDNGNSSGTFDISLLSRYIPLTPEGRLESCKRYVSGSNQTQTQGCNGNYVYDDTYYHSSRVIDMDLVCDKRWIRSSLQSIYILGVLVGAVLLGTLADRFGRKKIYCIGAIIQLLAALGCAFIPNIYAYTVVLFFYGMFGSSGSYGTGFVLSMELVGPSKRTLCGTAINFAFCVGGMVAAFWGYFIKEAWLLQTVYALHALILLPQWWLLDESIRWLWGQGRREEALQIAQKAVKTNGQEFINRYNCKMLSRQNSTESQGVTDLLKTPILRSRTLNVAFCWFANSLVYYGLSLNTGSLSGNPFIMLFLMSLAEVPAYATVVLLMDRTGRRSLCATMMFVGGLACVASGFLVHEGHTGTILAMVGKYSIAGSFTIVYNYTAELFPTVLRNSAVGMGSMSARISGALTPFITLLDTLDLRLPATIFGATALLSAFLTLLLPETLEKEMPQTLEDGENFGKGDNGYKTLWYALRRNSSESKRDEKCQTSLPA